LNSPLPQYPESAISVERYSPSAKDAWDDFVLELTERDKVPGRNRGTPMYGYFKRAIDLVVALVLCIVLAPLLVVVALAIRSESSGPALFRQQRRGKNMRPFTFVKFRSLRHGVPDPHANYEMVEEDPRITRVGAFLRRTSLDELPQLFNVLAGTMSLVGPRPLVEWESQLAWKSHPQRFEVKPGITGLSQVAVRNSVGFGERLDWDVVYVKQRSLTLDLRLLLQTPWSLLRGQAIYPQSR
jgi:lipopolysaccharide/colanic/teichoic acid biosynthesis glycosyltransferase